MQAGRFDFIEIVFAQCPADRIDDLRSVDHAFKHADHAIVELVADMKLPLDNLECEICNVTVAKILPADVDGNGPPIILPAP